MAEYTFFTHPMSRGQIARWALHEAGADYEQVLIAWDAKPAELLAANPMGKVPTVIHHHDGHDHVVSEAAAVCHYLAEMAAPGLLPRDEEKAAYFRWLFFAAGPVEQAVTTHFMKIEVSPEMEMSAGWGSYQRTMDTLERHLADTAFVCGERFTMADVYVGSAVDWGLTFGSFPSRGAFTAYAGRIRTREAYRAAKAIDNALIAEMQKGN